MANAVIRARWMKLLILAALLGCSESPAERVRLVQSVSTDGQAAYTVADVTFTDARVVRFDSDGDMAWERQVGSSLRGGFIHGDFLYVVEDEPFGVEEFDASSPDRLLKIDPNNGDGVGSKPIGPQTSGPRLMIDGQLWLLGDDRMAFELVDLDTLEIVETLDVRTGDILQEPDVEDVGGARYPIRHGDHVFFVADDPRAIVKYSIGRREIEGVVLVPELRIRSWPEVHGGLIWLPDSVSVAPGIEGWLGYPLDPERFEVGEPVPFLESPLWTLTTDEFVFDQTGIDEISQIDRDTGETLRTITGRHPQFVLDNNLWLANLERVELD